jgi:peptidoglycan/xylan/chitin deacetylase (PgdA/CDA1 family)
MLKNKLLRVAICVSIGCLFTASGVSAAGPAKVAVMSDSAWPLDYSSGNFNLQSRLLILSFVHSIEQAPLADSAMLAAYCGRKTVSVASVAQWKKRTYEMLVENFNAASTVSNKLWHSSLATDKVTISELVAASSPFDKTVPQQLLQWFTTAVEFTDAYAYELIRLAALFPKTTSEIAAFTSDEILGGEFKDKQFTLTFDDGPSAAGGTTDSLIALLRREQVNGRFFVLGEKFSQRVTGSSGNALVQLYNGMCVDVHGQTHVSHAKLADWYSSVMQCRSLVTQIFPERANNIMYFRPPYGQRTDSASLQLKSAQCKIMLWNIDSQDWNASLTNGRIAGRTLALMALWRRGIILFHDIHPKAAAVLPEILKNARFAGCQVVDCASCCN